MKTKAILVSFLALFAIVLIASSVIAITNSVDYVEITEVEVNGITVKDDGSVTAAGQVSNTIPVEIEFLALDDASDVKIKVYIEGYRSDISDTTSRFHIIDGSTYIKRFSLELPSSQDLDDLSEELNLIVRISAKGEESLELEYNIRMQRNLYSLNVLSVDAPEKVIAGSIFALDVVLENNGNEELENTYVRASIPELGISKKVYFGDIFPGDECDFDNFVNPDGDFVIIIDDCDNDDTVYKKVYLSVPRNAIPGIYTIEVEAYNYDTSVLTKEKIVITGAEAGILPSTSTKTVAPGEETTFDVILVNPNDRMVVYSISPVESPGLIIDVMDPVVTIASDSSRVAKIRVKATTSAVQGTHLVTVNVNSESGLVKQVTFSLNVESDGTSRNTEPNSVVVLTIVLAIIFVVLLIVLIVLLTKKPSESEEIDGETNYY